MKKVYLLMAVVAISIATNAQVSFGIQGGAAIAGLSLKSSTGSTAGLPKLNSRFGFKVGGVADVPLSNNISLMPQLNLVNKGYKYTQSGVSINSSLYYVEVPINVTYNNSGFFVGAGPSIALGIAGTTTYAQGADKDKVKVKFDGQVGGNDDYEHFKGLDFGGNIIAGYKLTNGLSFNVNYTFGLSNISTQQNLTAKNHYFGFGVGYFFNSK